MRTQFLPAERVSRHLLASQVEIATQHPVAKAILEAMSGAVVVLNEQRQIVACNLHLLEALGVSDCQGIRGLRPGEALNCRFSDNRSGGCGTTKACRCCGAALAILAAQSGDDAVERECLVDRTEGEPLEFVVRATPLRCGDHRLTVLTLRDVRKEKLWSWFERVFFHDMMNQLMLVETVAEELEEQRPDDRLTKKLAFAARQLFAQARAHHRVCQQADGPFCSKPVNTTTVAISADLERHYRASPLVAMRRVVILPTEPIVLYLDQTLLLRVAINMVNNALEATEEGGEVRIFWQATNGVVTFNVWNAGSIAAADRQRIFQRFHSTKGEGRGLGTYSMKLIGERVLGGKVGFRSDDDGTVFCLQLPRPVCRDLYQDFPLEAN